MSEITVFEHAEYRSYLESRLRSSEFGRGGKARLAQHLNCQPSFVSQVLKGKSTFSMEQAYKVHGFFQHNPLQKEYFMTLIEKDRAGTSELEDYFENKRLQLVEQSKLVENQMSYDQLSEADTIAYYNNWNSIQIRNLIDIPKYKTLPALKKKLKITEEEFNSAFQFLTDKGLIRANDKGELEQGHMRLHVKKESPLSKYANITARMQMIKNYDKASDDSLNYGCYMTIPRDSFEEFKKRLRQLIVELNDHLEDEQEADLMAALVIDFMEV